MEVSCVIATHNRKTIYKAIESIIQQSHSVELIVVDDGSNPPVCKEGIRIIRNSYPRGLSVCRNIGLGASSGEIIAFMDDDAWAEKDWVEQLVRSFVAGADIVGGMVVPVWERPRPWWLKDSMLHLLAINIQSRCILGCNFAVRRDLLERLNYKFEEKLGRKYNNLVVGDESELLFAVRKTGYKYLFNDAAVVYHMVPKERIRFLYFLKRNFWEGRTESRRHRVKSHLICYLRWLVRLTGEGFRSLDQEKIETSFIQLVLLSAYVYGIFFEWLVGARDYKES